MEAARKRQSWQAVASLRRQALSVRNELDQLKILQDQEQEQAAQPDDLVRSLVEAVRVLPLDHVERVAYTRTVCRRYACRIVHIGMPMAAGGL